MLCRKCYIPMSKVMSFSKNKKNTYEKFYKCSKCRKETKHIEISKSELDFGEYLHKELSRKGK